MSNPYRLVGVGNAQLLAHLSALVRQSNEFGAQLLAHLAELEERTLHLELGFSSLFSYCVEALGMSEGAAGRRVAAARVCRRFPQAFERVARGDLHLCALCALAPHLNAENATELFEASKGKTRRKVAEVVAARFPRPDVREQIRRLPVRAAVAAPRVEPGSSEATSVVELPEASRAPAESSSAATAFANPRDSRGAAQLPHAVTAPDPRVTASDPRRRSRDIEPLSPGRFGVHFTADAELRELLERARALASHRLPNGDLAGLIKLMAACFVQEEEKRRFGMWVRPRRAKGHQKLGRSAKQATPPGGVGVSPAATEVTVTERAATECTATECTATECTATECTTTECTATGQATTEVTTTESTTREACAVPPSKRGRYLAVEVRREVHARDCSQCAFVSADGQRCSARVFLEFDHVSPWAKFGASDASNIRLLCRAHNQLHARNCFGTRHVAGKIAARKRYGREI